MSDFLLYQHLGLGDHFICNGLVRRICEEPYDFHIVTKPTHYDTVNQMFQDVTNLIVVKLNSGSFGSPESAGEVYGYASENQLEIIKIGHEHLDYSMNFDKAFYHQFDIDFQDRWDNFKVIRNLDAENKLFDSLNITGEYAFVHDDPQRGMFIKGPIEGLRMINSNQIKTSNMFDFLTLIERAKEVHVIESSFMFLIDSLNFTNKLFAHRYARSYPANNTPTLKLHWKILT